MGMPKIFLCIRGSFIIGLKSFFLGNGNLLSTLIVTFLLVIFPNISLAKSKCDKWYSGSYSDTIFWGRGSVQEIADCVKKVGINHQDYVGSTPLHSAIIHHNPRMENVKYLLDRGADVNTYRKMLGWKSSPLISMAGKGDYSASQKK
jgi:hypothetical protein